MTMNNEREGPGSTNTDKESTYRNLRDWLTATTYKADENSITSMLNHLFSNHREITDLLSNTNQFEHYQHQSYQQQQQVSSKLEREIPKLGQIVEKVSVNWLWELDKWVEEEKREVEGWLEEVVDGIPKLEQEVRLLKYKEQQLHQSLASLEGDELITTTTEVHSSNPPVTTKTSVPPTEAYQIINNCHQEKLKLQVEITKLNDMNSWSCLESDIESALSQGNIIVAAKRYYSAYVSCQESQPNLTPELLETRQRVLSKLKTKIENQYRTALSEALKLRDSHKTKNYLTAYRILQEPDKVIKSYLKEPTFNLLTQFKEWLGVNSIRDEVEVGRNQDKVLGALGKLCDQLFNTIKSELPWVTEVFEGTTPTVFTKLTTGLFMELNPVLNQTIVRNPQHDLVTRYTSIISCHRTVDQFLKAVEKLLYASLPNFSASFENDTLMEPDSLEEEEEGAHSTRDTNFLRPLLLELCDSLQLVLEPYTDTQAHFATTELEFTRQRLTTSQLLDPKSSLLEKVDKLPSMVTSLFGSSYLQASLTRNHSLTYGFGIVHLFPSLNLLLKYPLDQIEELLSHIRADYILTTASQTSPTSTKKSKRDPHYTKSGTETRTDWNHFQTSLKLMNATLYFGEQLGEFLSSLPKRYRVIVEYINWSLQHSPLQHITTLLEPPSHQLDKDKREFLESVSLTSLQTILQSNLNSQELQTRLQNYQPDSPSQRTTDGFDSVTNQTWELVVTIQNTMFDILFHPFQQLLLKLNPTPSPTTTQSTPITIPKFSLPPTPCITTIGECLLALPQSLEAYVDDPGLYRHLTLLHQNPTSSSSTTTSTPLLSPETFLTKDHPIPSKADVLQAWIAALAQAIMVRSLSQIRSAFTSPQGSPIHRSQVYTDIVYLKNVVMALGVTPLPDLLLLQALNFQQDPHYQSILTLATTSRQSQLTHITPLPDRITFLTSLLTFPLFQPGHDLDLILPTTPTSSTETTTTTLPSTLLHIAHSDQLFTTLLHQLELITKL